MIELLSKHIALDNEYEIKEYYSEKGNIKSFCHKNCVQSLMYVDDELKNELCVPYFKLYDIPLEINSLANNYLVLGGGTFSYPKYFISHYLDKKMTVVEIDKKCIEIAEKYFDLDNFLNKFNDNRLSIVIDDALVYAKETKLKFDCILIDLFDGKTPVKEAYSILNLNYLKKILLPNGIIIANYIVSEENRKNYKKVFKALSKMFKYFKIISTDDNYDENNQVGNLLVIMSDNLIIIPSQYNYIDMTQNIIK